MTINERVICDGIVVFETYGCEGSLHREDGPAWIERDSTTGIVIWEAWYCQNSLHRAGAPAVIERDPISGAPTKQEFWIKGRELTGLPTRGAPSLDL